jgi:hypothetical protein
MSEVQLSQQQIEDLKALEGLHKQIADEIAKAESAGLNMDDYKQKLLQLEATRTGLLKVYGGLRRRKVVS